MLKEHGNKLQLAALSTIFLVASLACGETKSQFHTIESVPGLALEDPDTLVSSLSTQNLLPAERLSLSEVSAPLNTEMPTEVMIIIEKDIVSIPGCTAYVVRDPITRLALGIRTSWHCTKNLRPWRFNAYGGETSGDTTKFVGEVTELIEYEESDTAFGAFGAAKVSAEQVRDVFIEEQQGIDFTKLLPNTEVYSAGFRYNDGLKRPKIYYKLGFIGADHTPVTYYAGTSSEYIKMINTVMTIGDGQACISSTSGTVGFILAPGIGVVPIGSLAAYTVSSKSIENIRIRTGLKKLTGSFACGFSGTRAETLGEISNESDLKPGAFWGY